MYNPTEFEMGNTRMRTNKYRYMMDTWHPTRNPNADIPAAYRSDELPSSFMLHDASYIRLKNISLGYTFDLRKKTRYLRDITLSAACNNIFLISKYNGFDPDVSTSSGDSTLRRVDMGAYPRARTFTFNLQIKY